MLIAIVITAGCTVVKSHQMYAVSKAAYSLDEASSVWGRALQEFQIRNAVIGVADRDAGVLASPVQADAGLVSCGAGECEGVTSLQFTQYDGVATLNMWRRMTGVREWNQPLTNSADFAALQRSVDAALSRIVGKTATPVDIGSVAPVPAKKPPRLKMVGETCFEPTDCVSGMCSVGRCVR